MFQVEVEFYKMAHFIDVFISIAIRLLLVLTKCINNQYTIVK